MLRAGVGGQIGRKGDCLLQMILGTEDRVFMGQTGTDAEDRGIGDKFFHGSHLLLFDGTATDRAVKQVGGSCARVDRPRK